MCVILFGGVSGGGGVSYDGGCAAGCVFGDCRGDVFGFCAAGLRCLVGVVCVLSCFFMIVVGV